MSFGNDLAIAVEAIKAKAMKELREKIAELDQQHNVNEADLEGYEVGALKQFFQTETATNKVTYFQDYCRDNSHKKQFEGNLLNRYMQYFY